jgi:uridine kinase
VSARTAAVVVAWVLAAEPTLGKGRLVCVDGPAGAGKTTVADELVAALDEAGVTVQLVHMDDVYGGWSGLETGIATFAESVVTPLRVGQPGHYRRYDWGRSTYAEEHEVAPCDVLVVEGVGAGSTAYDEAITCLLWVDTPRELRLARSIARDGEAMRDRLLAWRLEEDNLFDRERTELRADLVIDGQSGEFAGPPFP